MMFIVGLFCSIDLFDSSVQRIDKSAFKRDQPTKRDTRDKLIF